MTRNTTGRYGMASAAPGKSMQDGGWINDTRKSKITVDVQRDPRHLDILDNFPGGTKFVLAANPVTQQTETLFAIEHGMPFPPMFLCYFYTRNAPSGFSARIGRYMLNYAAMRYNQPGNGDEQLYAEVDDTYFYIKHHATTHGIGSGNITFFGSDYLFRVRYEILNQPALVKSGKFF